MKKIIFSIVFYVLASSLYAQTQIIAHRGYWNCEGSAENSLSSLKNAQKEQLFGSEVDVHTTLDGVVVTNHDNDIHSLIINEHSFDQLQKVRLSNGEPLPTLNRHLELLAKSPCTKLIIEIKPKTVKAEEDEVVDAVLNLVKEAKMEKHVEYISFSKYICQKLKDKMPSSIVVYLSGSLETALTPQALKVEKFDGLDYHHSLISAHPNWIKEAKELGLITNVWTVNDEVTMKAMLELGVDYITTDNPLELKAIIANRRNN